MTEKQLRSRLLRTLLAVTLLVDTATFGPQPSGASPRQADTFSSQALAPALISERLGAASHCIEKVLEKVESALGFDPHAVTPGGVLFPLPDEIHKPYLAKKRDPSGGSSDRSL